MKNDNRFNLDISVQKAQFVSFIDNTFGDYKLVIFIIIIIIIIIKRALYPVVPIKIFYVVYILSSNVELQYKCFINTAREKFVLFRFERYARSVQFDLPVNTCITYGDRVVSVKLVGTRVRTIKMGFQSRAK